MAKGICSQEDCESPAKARGVCNAHYLRLRKSGELPPKVANPKYHHLTQVDASALTAICSQCGETRIRIRNGGRGPECMIKRRADRSKQGATAETKRRWKYQLSAHQLVELIKSANGHCAICDVAFGDEFHVDHCHETGAVRALLCKRCNLALGWFDDSPPRVLAAYMYLKGHGKADDDWQHRDA